MATPSSRKWTTNNVQLIYKWLEVILTKILALGFACIKLKLLT